MSKKFIVSYEYGKPTKKAIQLEVYNGIKKTANVVSRYILALVLIAATFFFRALYLNNEANTQAVKNNIKGKHIEISEETRTETDNLLSTVNVQVFSQVNLDSGTGVVISMSDEMLILTARHVVDKGSNVSYVIRFYDGSETSATLKYVSSDYDWSVLSIPKDNVPLSILSIVKPAIFEENEVVEGEKVYNIRDDYLDETSVYNGKINKDSMFQLSQESLSLSGWFIETDYSVKIGASGGGLFNENGRLIGICSQSDEIMQRSLFCKTKDIKDWLTNLE